MIGKTVSHYRILEELGRGGMGVVYRAEDTKLGREVALKFLPTELENDSDAQERFLHEARAASALDHPNICTIHEINEFEGRHFIAMAFVEGQDLKEKISSGPLPIGEAIDIVAQIAEGIETAHDKRITHRDIKPANIMMTPGGRVKIMDFGLAKSPGRARLTREGTTLGTTAYMSPEQARGAEADHRSDIWSFGVVLYEMLTGKQPFEGEYEQAVLYSIMNSEPEPIGHLRTDIPTGLEGIVKKAMNKNRDARYSSVKELTRDLEILKRERAGGNGRQPAGRKRFAAAIGVSAVVVIAAVFAVSSYISRRGGQAPPPVSRQLTYTGATKDCALSPDGNYIAFVNAKTTTEEELWVKDIASGSAVKLYSNMMCANLKWSPDGSSILFSTLHDENSGGVYVIPRLGGTARQLISSPWLYTSWSPDGASIMSIGFGQRAVSILDIESGGADTVLFDVMESDITFIEWSPSGNNVLFMADDDEYQELWIASIEGTDKAMIRREKFGTTFFIMHPKWAPDGKSVYYLSAEIRGRLIFDLMKIRMAAETGKGAKEPVCVMAGLRASANSVAGGVYSISGDGKKLLYIHEDKHSNIWMVTVEGNGGDYSVEKRQLTTGTEWKSRAAISPDGNRIAFAMIDEKGMNIYSMPLEDQAAEPEQLTFLDSLNDLPVWSPDGREIAFFSNQGGIFRVWKMGADGRSPKPFEGTAVLQGGSEIVWAPGPKILYQSSASGLENWSVLDPVTGEERMLIEDPPAGYIFYPEWSPGGKEIAFFWNSPVDGRQVMRTWILSVEDGARRMLLDEISIPLKWAEDGESIYISKPGGAIMGSRGEMYKMNIASGALERYVTAPFEKGISRDRFAMTPDGRKLVYSIVEEQSDIWLIEDFDPDVK